MKCIAGSGTIQFIGAVRKTIVYPDWSQVPFPVIYTAK
jgi:hypothetical protein